MITIGADELILWMRKHNPENKLGNEHLGKKISDWILANGGKHQQANKRAKWNHGSATTRKKLPKTAMQYELDPTVLEALYAELKSW